MPEASFGNGYFDKVWEIRTLGKQRDQEAKRILKNIADQVDPILKQRKWKVKLLSEFSPSNPNLLGLNVNRGQEIKIRLRPLGREDVFFPYGHILGTALHEMAHIQRGPHDAQFFKLLEELERECDSLMISKATGHQVGGREKNIAARDLRKAAAEAAERRVHMNKIMPSGPKRLGGNLEISRLLSPLQAVAMAVEQRANADLWCDSGDANDKAGQKESFAVPNKNVDSEAKCSSSRTNQNSAHDYPPVTRGRVGSLHLDKWPSIKVPWICSTCTLENKASVLVCDACGNAEPSQTVSTAKKRKKAQEWICKFCTLENDSESAQCLACTNWQYSQPLPSAVIETIIL